MDKKKVILNWVKKNPLPMQEECVDLIENCMICKGYEKEKVKEKEKERHDER